MRGSNHDNRRTRVALRNVSEHGWMRARSIHFRLRGTSLGRSRPSPLHVGAPPQRRLYRGTTTPDALACDFMNERSVACVHIGAFKTNAHKGTVRIADSLSTVFCCYSRVTSPHSSRRTPCGCRTSNLALLANSGTLEFRAQRWNGLLRGTVNV